MTLQVLQILPHLSYQRFLVGGSHRVVMRFHSLAGPQVLFGIQLMTPHLGSVALLAGSRGGILGFTAF